jgi:hypothetical protein
MASFETVSPVFKLHFAAPQLVLQTVSRKIAGA